VAKLKTEPRSPHFYSVSKKHFHYPLGYQIFQDYLSYFIQDWKK